MAKNNSNNNKAFRVMFWWREVYICCFSPSHSTKELHKQKQCNNSASFLKDLLKTIGDVLHLNLLDANMLLEKTSGPGFHSKAL